jgi:hemerythrin-like domain-containing protein
MSTSTDAIVMLREDHQELRRVFREFERAKDATAAQQRRLADKMMKLLTEHTYVENEVMYPRVREMVPKLEDDILESYEEHHVADLLISELALMRPSDERYRPKALVLIENVRHHMDEEENDWFPKVRDALGRNQLQELGTEMKAARKNAPGPPERSALQKAVDAVFRSDD